MTTKPRVLLLSEAPPVGDHEARGGARPDIDLTEIVEDLYASLARQPDLSAVHRPVADEAAVQAAVRECAPDVVFNACETLGGGAETELVVPTLLERLGVPFTGNSVRCLRTCLHKVETNEILRHAAVLVPATFFVNDDDACAAVPESAYPVVVKPDCEDGSLGIDADSVAIDRAGLSRIAEKLRAAGLRPIAQQYVDGREIVATLLGRPLRVLSPGEILFDERVFGARARILTWASKWEETSIDYGATRSVAADLSPALLAEVSGCALAAATALGMRDYGRVDMRVSAEGRPYVIDVNPNCDLSEDGGFMRAVKRASLTRDDVVATLVRCALERGARDRPS